MAALASALIVFADREIVPNRMSAGLRSISSSSIEELDALPPQSAGMPTYKLDVMKELRLRTPADALFVVFDPNTFAYYAGRRYIRDVDPRLAPFYQATDKFSAFRILKQLGVQYVYLQEFGWPTIDHSFIHEILADTTLSTKVFEKFGCRVYRLADDEAGSPALRSGAGEP
jgi:hypothetical protein